MIDRDFAKHELQKLGQLRFPPQTKIALDVLIDKLAEVARSEAHCRSIVEEILDNPGEEERWPTSKTLSDIAWRLLDDAERAVGCSLCLGTGWISAKQLVRGVVYDFASPCTCRPAPPAPEATKPKPERVKVDWSV